MVPVFCCEMRTVTISCALSKSPEAGIQGVDFTPTSMVRDEIQMQPESLSFFFGLCRGQSEMGLAQQPR